MAEFLMQIAGAVAKVTALFDSTPHYFRPYLTEAAPDFSDRKSVVSGKSV